MSNRQNIRSLGRSTGIHASTLSRYLTCSQQWWFSDVDRVEVDDTEAHRNRIAGSALHELISNWHKAGEPAHSLLDLHGIVTREYDHQAEGYIVRYPMNEPRIKLLEMMVLAANGYMSDPRNRPDLAGFKMLGIEQAFRVWLERGKTRHLFHGRIDQLRQYEDGTTELIDLKWSSSPAEFRSVRWDHQLTLYGLAMAEGEMGEFVNEHSPEETFFSTIPAPPAPLQSPPDRLGILSLRGYIPYRSSRKSPEGGYHFKKGDAKPDSARWSWDVNPQWTERRNELFSIVQAMRFGIHYRRDTRTDLNNSPCSWCDWKVPCLARDDAAGVSIPESVDKMLDQVNL